MSKSKQKHSAENQEPVISKTNTSEAGGTETQLTAFDKAMKLFHKRDFAGALPLFGAAEHGADLSMAHAAKLHARMCQQRLDQQSPTLKTSEDNYAYGLALANRRELNGAESYLNRALQLAPGADHVLYTLALVKGLQGDLPSAAGLLARAIELQPSNRSTVRTDPDFHELLRHPAIREIVF